MEKEIKNKQTNEKKYFWLVTPYLVSVGLLYLWGYWWSFGINVFEFASLSDIVMVAIIPVGSAFVFFLMGSLIAEFGYAKHLPEGGGMNTSVGRVLNNLKPFLIILYWSSVLFLIFSTLPWKWFAIPVWTIFGPYILLKNSSFLQVVEDDSRRSLLILTLVILTIFSFSKGKINANNVLNDMEYFYTKVNGEVQKYIGHVGKKYFFLSKDNSEIFIKDSNKESLRLKKYHNKLRRKKTIDPADLKK